MHIFLPWFASVSVCPRGVCSILGLGGWYSASEPSLKLALGAALCGLHGVTGDFLCNRYGGFVRHFLFLVRRYPGACLIVEAAYL